MYYDESTSVNIEVLSRTATYKVVCDGSTSTFTITDVRIKYIDYVTINYVKTTGYTLSKSESGVINRITLSSTPTAGSILRINYYVGSPVTYNTWSNFEMAPKSRVSFAPAKVKTSYKEVDGGDIYFDYTDYGRNEASFEPVSGTWEFLFPPCLDTYDWNRVYAKVKNTLSGKNTNVSLVNYPSWERSCRLTVDSYSTADKYSTVKIGYKGKPFETYITTSSEDWLWDPFSFEDDPIHQWTEADIINDWHTVSGSSEVYWQSGWFTWGRQTVMPTFNHSGAMTVELWWRADINADAEGHDEFSVGDYDTYSSVTLADGVYTDASLQFKQGQCYMKLTKSDGSAYTSGISVTATEGRL